jgi:diaminohydroxyphosphoribosylaminopyrimidine deaminase/5-amino-6-(5-phosphoribosylamino)uracil reductase
MLNAEETYMRRCLDLARLGEGHTAPNPMVGAVLVHDGRIIGEGYHKQYGQSHAEVNCIHSVKKEDESKIGKAVLYVSLEPCTHTGKTPPCTDLIIRKKIPKVVIACKDPFREVNGRGIEKLKAAGVEVHLGVLEDESIGLNKRFFVFHIQKRPYIVLKWAQSANGKIASADSRRVFISNEFTNRLVHKWRAQEASILVGTNTALLDDPSLTLRFWNGRQPLRLILDRTLRLPLSLKVFDRLTKTIVFNNIKQLEEANLEYRQVSSESSLVGQVIRDLYLLNIQSVLVEGGSKLLQSFIDEEVWDEARVITNEELFIENGISSPVLSQAQISSNEILFSDRIRYYHNPAKP